MEVPVQVADVLTKPLSRIKFGLALETSLVWSLARGSDYGETRSGDREHN